MSSNAKVKTKEEESGQRAKLGEKEMQQDSCTDCTNNYGFRV
jgi:hypothetical protein